MNGPTFYYPMLREIYDQALVAAFDLSQLVDGMQEDLEPGKTLDLLERELT